MWQRIRRLIYLRHGHKSLGSFQEGLEAEIKLKTILETVEQGELIDKDGPSGKAASMSQSLGGDLTMTIEDTLEVLVEMLDG